MRWKMSSANLHKHPLLHCCTVMVNSLFLFSPGAQWHNQGCHAPAPPPLATSSQGGWSVLPKDTTTGRVEFKPPTHQSWDESLPPSPPSHWHSQSLPLSVREWCGLRILCNSLYFLLAASQNPWNKQIVNISLCDWFSFNWFLIRI